MRSEAHGRHATATTDNGALAERLSRAYVAHALVGALPRRRARLPKRALDLLLAPPIYLFTAPLRLTAALPYWLRARRCVTIQSTCAGYRGRIFTLRQLDQRPASASTPGNAWLGASQLAKSPALAHVLRGSMTLVGPAPWTCDAIETQWDTRDLARLYVAPGIITLRPIGALRRLATQAEADLWYVSHGSFATDAQQIWAATFLPRRRFQRAQ